MFVRNCKAIIKIIFGFVVEEFSGILRIREFTCWAFCPLETVMGSVSRKNRELENVAISVCTISENLSTTNPK